jgi:TIR domain
VDCDTTNYAFVSYSRQDSPFAIQLARDLNGHGIDVWIDLLDIPAGRNWDKEVEIALVGATTVLVIVSEDSSRSDQVADEIDYAVAHKKVIIPLLKSHVVLPMRLFGLKQKAIDLHTDYGMGLQSLVDALAGTQKQAEPRAIALAAQEPAGTGVIPEALRQAAARDRSRYAYISYSQQDETFATQLTRDLKGQGIEAWIGPLAAAGVADLGRAVEIALRDATFVLVVVSKDSAQSDQVRNEISYALEHQKRIVPLLTAQVDLPLRLFRLQRVDFTGDYSSALRTLANTLCARGEREDAFADALAAARPAGIRAIPTFQGELGHFEKAKAFRDFIVNHEEQVVAIDAYIPGDQFDGIADQFFVLWDGCEDLEPGEKPSFRKCAGTEYNVPKAEGVEAALWYSRGAYHLTGFFLVGRMAGPFQGLMGISLTILDSKQVALGHRL